MRYKAFAITVVLNIWMLCAIYNLIGGIFNVAGGNWTVERMDAMTGL